MYKWKTTAFVTYQCFHVGRTFLSAQFVVVLDSAVLLFLTQARTTLGVGAFIPFRVHNVSLVSIVFQVNHTLFQMTLILTAHQVHTVFINALPLLRYNYTR